MRIILVGADLEENLGLGMLAASAESVHHKVRVIAFNERAELASIANEIIADNPDVVGLSLQFQHRAHEFLSLAAHLRSAGYRGHLTCGGQHPSMAWREVLEGGFGLDSVVLFEGEQIFVDLLEALQEGVCLEAVAGLALLGLDGRARLTSPRPLVDDLDTLPFPKRYRSHAKHFGIPFIPIMGSRGCWGRCSFCSITSFYRDARVHGGGKLLRRRSPQNIAEEMAWLSRATESPAIFCFHDDNFLMPRPQDSLLRVSAIRQALDERGIGPIGLVGKCRPDSLTPSLARELKKLGVIRLYVGVENASQRGADHLQRRVAIERVREALATCREAGIFACYNLLLFEPEAKLEDIEENLAFIRAHAYHPVNFCRAEPYCGTPLQVGLAEKDRLSGSYLGYDYRIRDDRVELLFRICAGAFRERNFAPHGVHNRYMGLGYSVSVLARFYDDPNGIAAIRREADELTRSIATETAGFLEEAIQLARENPANSSDFRDHIERETGLLALRVSAADRKQHARLDEIFATMTDFSARARRLDEAPRAAPSTRMRLVQRFAQGVSVSVWLAASATTTQSCSSRAIPTDNTPKDAGKEIRVLDMVPHDASVDKPTSYDPAPPDGGRESYPPDPLPVDGGMDGMMTDPLPMPDFGLQPSPADGTSLNSLPAAGSEDLLPNSTPRIKEQRALATHSPARRYETTGKWRDTTPRRAVRSADLPLFDPPVASLSAVRTETGIKVTLHCDQESIGLRWESDGGVSGDGREVLWQPVSANDQIRVGVRTKGGVAVVALRQKDVA